QGAARAIAYIPHVETVAEFRIETSNFDASSGGSTGIGMTLLTKPGTNQFHGAVSNQHWQQRWNGSPFFVKQAYYSAIAEAAGRGDNAQAERLRSQDKQAPGHSNHYAASLGGPVIIPGVFNGKDKLFFFFNYAGFKMRRSEEADHLNYTIPTLANRAGDFSQLLQADAVRYQIYDPLSIRADPARPGNYIRTPFNGNIIPRNRWINPGYDTYAKFLPIPNRDPQNPRLEPTNNFLGTNIPLNFNYDAYHSRVDYHHSDAHRLFGRWSWNDWINDRDDWTFQTVRGLSTAGATRQNLTGAVDWVVTRSATTVFDFFISANQFRDGNIVTVPLQYKPSDVGLPAYMDQKAGEQTLLPSMAAAGYARLGRAGYPTLTQYRMLFGKADVTHIRGSHTFRAGFESRQQFRTGGGGGNTSGNFTFDNSFTRRNDDTLTPAGSLGHSWAAFLLGLPSGLSVDTNDTFALHSPYYGWYGMDTWRISRKLSLTLGLRAEYEMGATERYNRFISPPDLSLKLPISDPVEAAYRRSPIPELAPDSFHVLGGTVYPGVNGKPRRAYRNELMWLPRLAAAYQLDNKTVLRTGYGMYFDTLNVLNFGLTQTGFSRTTSTNPTDDFGVNWLVGNPGAGISPLRDPFPVRSDGTRFDAPLRDALGSLAVAGRPLTFDRFDRRHARQQRWRVAVDRQLNTNMMVSVAYAGSFSDRVEVPAPLSPLPEKFWADGTVRNNTIESNLNANV
ncbi:MAG: hypothetical protein ABIZ80_13460, partial [Bryobacteraceae bacterium]